MFGIKDDFAFIGAMLIAVAATSTYARAGDRITGIAVQGTAFQVQLASGKMLSPQDLIGATLSLMQPGTPAPLTVRVVSTMLDPQDRDHETLLYRLLSVDPRTGGTQELCGPNAEGEHWGFPLRGQWDAEGRHISNAGYTLTCADGAQGKCVRFGYKPWKTLRNGTKLEPYHQACVRLVRADYCGGHGTTRDGILIDLYDKIGIQNPEPAPTASGLRFEAAWSPAGAVCVAHTRVPENVSLRQLAMQCPRLTGHLGADACSEPIHGPSAAAALLFNRSR